MQISLMGKSSGLILAIALVAGCSSEPAEPAAGTSEPEAATVETRNEIVMSSPVEDLAPEKTSGGDLIRGKGGLEEECLAQVADVTRAPVIGTNRIEESEAAIEIYVNVDGAQAPWKCLGYKDGTIAEVMYTGDEGAL